MKKILVEFAKTYKSGSIVEAEITSIMDFGIFVKAPLGIEGLINKSNLSDSREESFEEAVKKYTVGDTISVYVVDVNPGKEKAAFSVKEYKQKMQRDEMSQYLSQGGGENADAYTLAIC